MVDGKSGRNDGLLPDGLLAAIKEADWYESLRSCVMNSRTRTPATSRSNNRKNALYLYRTGYGERASIIEDLIVRMDADIQAVEEFLGVVFLDLDALLTDATTVQPCGLHQGKALIREISPEPALSFDSGKCLAVAWIEVDGKPTCPRLCGAYRAKAATQTLMGES